MSLPHELLDLSGCLMLSTLRVGASKRRKKLSLKLSYKKIQTLSQQMVWILSLFLFGFGVLCSFCNSFECKLLLVGTS